MTQTGPQDGGSVLFLHGAASSGEMWRPQTQVLSRDLQCLVVDLPGHGHSETIPWRSLDDAAARVAEIIQDRAPGSVTMIGMSLGGYVALQVALTDHDLLAGVIVSGVSVLPASFSTRMWQRGQVVARYTNLGRRGSAGSGSVERPDADGAAPRANGRTPARQAVLKIADVVVNFELPEQRRKIGCDLLAVAGEHERREVLMSLRPLAQRFEPSWAKYVPEAGHAWNTEQAELFNAMVYSWVSERRLPPKLRDPEQWTS